MSYDEELAARIRELIGRKGVTEMRMFGGLAFLINGNMAVAASGQGGLLLRADPSDPDGLVRSGAAHPMVMRGKAMPGWLRVESDKVRTKKQLEKWVTMSAAYARSLPPKKA